MVESLGISFYVDNFWGSKALQLIRTVGFSFYPAWVTPSDRIRVSTQEGGPQTSFTSMSPRPVSEEFHACRNKEHSASGRLPRARATTDIYLEISSTPPSSNSKGTPMSGSGIFVRRLMVLGGKPYAFR